MRFLHAVRVSFFWLGFTVLAGAAAPPQVAQDPDRFTPDKDKVFIVDAPSRTPEEMAAAAQEISPVTYTPPADSWENLPRTAGILASKGKELFIVMLGDSIVNDMARSRWGDLLQQHYPDCKIHVVAIVRGGTGCWWYKAPGRVSQYVLPWRPDLLIIGGISQRSQLPGANSLVLDTDSIRDVIQQVRSVQPCDVLLVTGFSGLNNPFDKKSWSFDIPGNPKDDRKLLRDLAAELHTGFLDMTAVWGLYVLDSGHPLGWFKRDELHSNARGEQVVGRILAAHLSSNPAVTAPPATGTSPPPTSTGPRDSDFDKFFKKPASSPAASPQSPSSSAGDSDFDKLFKKPTQSPTP